jgi:hypothetical protein
VIVISYIRAGHELKWFDDTSASYVFPSVGMNCANHMMPLNNFEHGTPCDCFVEDYGDKYPHAPTFIELIGKLIWRETDDEKYATKMVIILAHKMHYLECLRDEYRKIADEMWLVDDGR